MENLQLGIIGSGNVATHLALGLYQAGFTIGFISSRNTTEGRKLARRVQTDFVMELPVVTRKPYLLFICTPDDVINSIAEKFNRSGYILVHCSGGIPLLPAYDPTVGTGVFYPVQTFSKKGTIVWDTIPLCIEGSTRKVELLLRKIGKKLSQTVISMTSKDRATVHVAAVFANNFNNAQFTIAESLLKENGLSFDLLKPLILQTAKNVQTASPQEVQTGPARRNDSRSIRMHLSLLRNNHPVKVIYKRMTDFIFRWYS